MIRLEVGQHKVTRRGLVLHLAVTVAFYLLLAVSVTLALSFGFPQTAQAWAWVPMYFALDLLAMFVAVVLATETLCRFHCSRSEDA